MITKIVLHCSDSPDGQIDIGAEDIHEWHLKRGWSGIGYHYVITKQGGIEEGRPEYWEGAHVSGHNACSLGICLVGRSKFNAKQFAALKVLLYKLKFEHQDAEICGHYQLDNKKTCPNFDVPDWVSENMPNIDYAVRH